MDQKDGVVEGGGGREGEGRVGGLVKEERKEKAKSGVFGVGGAGSLMQLRGDLSCRRIKRVVSDASLERQHSKERSRVALGKEMEDDEEDDEKGGDIAPMLEAESVELSKKVGSGSYGEVYEATYNGQIVAVKVPTKLNNNMTETGTDLLKKSSTSLFQHNMMDDHQLKQLRKEIQVLTTKRHPSLLMMMGICLAETGIWIVTEFCGNKDLLAYFEKKGNYVTPMQVCEWRLQVAEGMRWLHSEPCVLHLDLKLDNVFLDENLKAKIGDFGISAITQKQNEKRDGKTMGMTLGNMLHEAPEVIQGLPFDSKADVYGFGILCWEISNASEWDASMTAEELSSSSVDELTEIFERGIVNGTRRPKLVEGQTRLNNLLTNCWANDPQKRLNFQEIVPKLKLLTIYSLIPVEPVADFWVEKFGDAISVPFKTFMAALSRSQLINQKEFLNKRAKLAIRRLLQVNNDSSPVPVDVFGRFARCFMAFPPVSPSCLVNAFRSSHFDPFATEEDVHSLLEETPEGTGVITYVSPYERHNRSISAILHTTGKRGELEQDLVLADPEEQGFVVRFSSFTSTSSSSITTPSSSSSSSVSSYSSSAAPASSSHQVPPSAPLPSSASASSLASTLNSPTRPTSPSHPLSASSPNSCPNSPLTSSSFSRTPPPELPKEMRFSTITELCKWVELRNEELMSCGGGGFGSPCPFSPSPSPLLPTPPLNLPRATAFSPRARSGTYSPTTYKSSSPTSSSPSSSSSPRPSPLSFRSSPLSVSPARGSAILPLLSISSPKTPPSRVELLRSPSTSRSSSPPPSSPMSSSPHTSRGVPSSTPPPQPLAPHKSSSTSSLFSLPK